MDLCAVPWKINFLFPSKHLGIFLGFSKFFPISFPIRKARKLQEI
jgi:hypothetical protein